MRSSHGSATVTTAALAALVAVLLLLVAAAPVPDRRAQVRICHVTPPAELLRSTRCPAGTLTYRLGYIPATARLPDGRTVHVEPDGTCSWLPDRTLGFDFRDACRMHDLGYDLMRIRWVAPSAKPRIDRELFEAMRASCAAERGLRRVVCTAIAGAAWAAAVMAPTPRDPDPGSFTSTPHPRSEHL